MQTERATEFFLASRSTSTASGLFRKRLDRGHADVNRQLAVEVNSPGLYKVAQSPGPVDCVSFILE